MVYGSKDCGYAGYNFTPSLFCTTLAENTYQSTSFALGEGCAISRLGCVNV